MINKISRGIVKNLIYWVVNLSAMSKEKKLVVALVAVLLISVVMYFVQGSGHRQELKRITKELQLRTDSLEKIHANYDSIRIKYDTIAAQLEKTHTQLHYFRRDLDSIMGANISSVANLRSSLERILARRPTFTRIDTINNDRDSLRFDI